MLVERWQEVVAKRGRDWAVHDLTTDRRWSFSELAAAAERLPDPGPMVFPQGTSVGFLQSVLQGWHWNRVVCPLEPGQARPDLIPPPAGTVHLKLTSGTTGEPKGVRFTAEQLAADPAAIQATMGLTPASPNLGVISLAHSYGFSNLVLPLLLGGIPLILVPSPLPAVLQRAAVAQGETRLTLPAVPALWRTWFEARAIPGNVQLAISAGAPLSLPLEQCVHQEFGLKLHNFLGASECGGIAYDGTELPRTDPTVVGTALQGVQLARNADGCLEVRGPSVGSGYWPERLGPLEAGVFRTSDLIEFGANGIVLLRGRLSDVIQVAGRKVTPESIEAVLREHPAVADCLVLGVPSDEARGEAVAVVVEVRGEYREVELKSFLQARLPDWQWPRLWRRVESLGVNGRGKRSRAEWRQSFTSPG